MKRNRPSLYTLSIDLSKNVQCLLESGQTPETIRYTVEVAIILFCTMYMETHGKYMHIFAGRRIVYRIDGHTHSLPQRDCFLSAPKTLPK